jgi:hypothetical protein
MANIYVEGKTPIGAPVKESLLAASVTGYARGLAVTYGSDAFHCLLITATAAAALGIIEEDQVVGANATAPTNPVAVIELGMAVAQIGANITALQPLTTNASGQLIPAQAGQPVVAIALEAQTYVSPGSFATVLVVAPLGIMAPGDEVSYVAASGAIPLIPGTYALNGAAALAMTLAAPTAAQDGTIITIVATTGHAHTVTAPADAIYGTKDTVTYAAVGDIITLEAVNTKWMVRSIGGPTPTALSEV